MYLHTQQPPQPRSPPRVVVHRPSSLPEGASGVSPAAPTAPTATTAVAAHLTSDVRRRLRMELHSQHLQHLQHRHLYHAHYQQYHGSLSGRPLQEDRAVGDCSGGVSSHAISSSEGGTSSSAARRAAVAMLQDGLQRIDEEEKGKKPHKITGAATAPLAAKRPMQPTTPNPSTLPLTIGMGMLRTTSAGSLPSLLRAGKRQLSFSTTTTTTTTIGGGGGGDDGAKEGNIRGGATAAGDVAEGHSHKKQGMANHHNNHGITLASSASASASSSSTAAGSAATAALGAGSGMGIFTSSRRGRPCGDLGSSSAFSKSVPASLHLDLPDNPETATATTQPQLPQQQTTSLSGFALPFPNILTAPRPPACPSPVGRTCGAATIKGRKPGRPLWENQDSYLFVEPEDGTVGGAEEGLVGMYAVMDGHGEAGHKISCHCREHLPQLMAQVGYDPHRAYALMQEELKSAFGQTVASSGCTCVMALLRRHRGGSLHLTVANLGDSRCVLGRRRVRSTKVWNVGGVGSDGSSSSSSGSSDDEEGEGKEEAGEEASIVAIALSDDHKPDRPSEHRRIVAAGGRVGCRQHYVSGHGRSASMASMTVQLGPPRLWYPVGAQGELTGLAMSRSLGDVAAHLAGGCAEPEVLEHVVAPGDEFVVLATDGLWDVVGNQLAVELVDAVRAKAGGGNWDPKEAARALLQFARQRWEALSPEMIDDISVLVVKLR